MLLRMLKDLVGGRKAAPPHVETADELYHAAQVAYLANDGALALDYCRRLRRAAPGFEAVDILEAQIRFGGEGYFQILERILDAVRPRSYVEIGVETGESLRRVKAPIVAIGIDPQPKLTAPLASNQKLFVETSDAFFAGHDLRAELGGLPVDLAFIDGMHHFDFALRDFANLERYCTPASTILIHDCYPLDRETAERERRRTFWSGDVWRLIVLLKKYRPDLAIHTVATAPTGLAVVRKLDPGSRLLLERHDQLCREFLALDYSHIEDDMAGKLNLFPNEWGRIRALLG
ncbi:MAG TPA: class I SAM-dependent methyltransferase [Burkholderiales bacterium]|nr:class I SAM-dependent methyltransferase [Burkholderiales bacterium]